MNWLKRLSNSLFGVPRVDTPQPTPEVKPLVFESPAGTSSIPSTGSLSSVGTSTPSTKLEVTRPEEPKQLDLKLEEKAVGAEATITVVTSTAEVVEPPVKKKATAKQPAKKRTTKKKQ